MASDNTEYEGAVGGVGTNMQLEFQGQNDSILEDIIDLDKLKFDQHDEESWLTASLYKPAEDSIFKDDSIEEWINLSSTKFLMESGFTGPGATGDASFNFSNVSHMSKKSLLNKLETISKGPTTTHNASSGTGSGAGTSTCSSNLSPNVSSYLRQNFSSTPASKGHSRFDPRTFTRSQLRQSNAGFGSPLSNQTSHYSSSPSKNQLSNLNISEISLVECSPLIGIAETPASSPKPVQSDLTFDRRITSNTQLFSPQKEETASRISPLKATNETYEKLQSQDPSSPNATQNFKRSQLSQNGDEPTFNLQVPCKNDNPNSTFDVLIQDKSVANATFTCDRNSSDNTNCNESRNLRKKTYAITTGNNTITLKNDTFSNDPANANLNNVTYDNCDISDSSRGRNSIQSKHQNETKQSTMQDLSRDSSQGLKQTILPQHQRSATISPSSEHSLQSPSTDIYANNDNNNMYDVGEDKTREQECEVQLSHESNSRGGYQQYSSQDSLPDSPYSSQSLDSQSTQGADGLRRSMPNLNRIRGRGGGFGYRGGIARNAGIPGASSHRATNSAKPAMNYGLSKINNSNARLGNEKINSNTRMLPPNSIPHVGRNLHGRQEGIPPRGMITGDNKIGSRNTQTFRYQGNVRTNLCNSNRNTIEENNLSKPSHTSTQISSQQLPTKSTASSNPVQKSSLIQRPGLVTTNNLTSIGSSHSKLIRPIGSGIPRPRLG